ncbi:MAG: hypothetical protein KME28_23330 [Pelatocladus maniniholoensis HA4357-MV3]|jgi:hypothetical protein|uniref:Uncharacterized protein n=1 Tax=Pelatocladus maniniholoensis HA4357-MV3 TaxID=1117104 RepID=A0A9E3LW09_9NOST|nr:hypothetical protein [Pelatocladus maniniholoensis HA4357-MV3]BAZ67251.1 hypothetical protein NIES4106_20050 [Fischerella sp. NIES-4106]
MGKYDKFFESEEVLEESLNPNEAIAAVAVVTAIADSSIEDVDAELLTDILWGFEIFDEYSDDELLEMIDKLLAFAEDEGVGTLFNTAYECLDDELIPDAFAAGVSMLVDEEDLLIPKGKATLLKKLQQALELEDDEAKEIVEEVITAFEEAEDEDFLDDEEDEEDFLESMSSQTIYESPAGNFTVPVPSSLRQGAMIDSQEGIVIFSDDLGSLFRIDYSSLPTQQMYDMESVGQEEYLRSILLNKYVPSAIASNLPDASVDYTEYLSDVLEGAYFTLVNMPEGSTVPKTGNNGTAIKCDAYRGLLAFIDGDFLYIVSSQRSFCDGETPAGVKQEAQNLKQSIISFVDTIEFS